jgi:hypothetical protein
MGATFSGWIPTVSGALSFSTFGDVSHPPRAKRANRSDGNTRYLICYRAKDCSDVLLPVRSLLGPILLRLRGKLRFLCVASAPIGETGTQDVLRGQVFIFDDRKIWREHVLPRVAEAQTKLTKFKYGVDGVDLATYFGARFQTLLDELPTYSAFNASFTVTRTGMAELIVPDPMVVRSGAPRLPTEEPKRRHVTHLIAAQLFFFLRDIGHRHQHHDPNTDTIVDLYDTTNKDPFDWKLQTLFALYRKVISYKRIRERGSYSASLGVVAYANTFRALIEDGISKIDAQKLPKFYSENVVASVRAIDAEMERTQEEKIGDQDVTRELILAALAIVIAVVGVFQVTDYKVLQRPAEVLYLIAGLLIGSPIATLLGIIAIMTIIRFVTGLKNPANFAVFRFLLRILQPLHFRVVIAAFALAGIVLLILLFLILAVF